MDTNTPGHEDNLNALEHLLSGWRPGDEGLDADAMLFAAGLAAGQRGRARFVAPVLCGLLAVLALALGLWGLHERSERQALASRLHEQVPAPRAAPPVGSDVDPASSYEPSANDYLSMRRRMEDDPGGWLAYMQPVGHQPPGRPPPQPAILTPRPVDGAFFQ
jgi:hypothetical protein